MSCQDAPWAAGQPIRLVDLNPKLKNWPECACRVGTRASYRSRINYFSLPEGLIRVKCQACSVQLLPAV